MRQILIFLFAIVLYSCNNNNPSDPPKDPADDTLEHQAKPDTTLKEEHKPKQ